MAKEVIKDREIYLMPLRALIIKKVLVSYVVRLC